MARGATTDLTTRHSSGAWCVRLYVRTLLNWRVASKVLTRHVHRMKGETALQRTNSPELRDKRIPILQVNQEVQNKRETPEVRDKSLQILRE